VIEMLLFAWGSGALAAGTHRGAYPCFPMHGALADDIGHPSYRITPETPDGLLAVRDGDRGPPMSGSFSRPIREQLKRRLRAIS
ncbi:MAG TPA: hypothetical protein VGQ34_08580, partial [Sphingomicrobium sp.]|nr:hypothetical protein [Sphingomicrobium sp.]